LAHLLNGDTYHRLAAGFGIGTGSVYLCLRETIDLLATHAVPVHRAVYLASRLLYVILDGTLIPSDRVAVDRPYYSGEHKRHGVNVQILADTRGRLLWAQELERADQAAPLPKPSNRDHQRNARPTTSRGATLTS
jgi:hypothetical protein